MHEVMQNTARPRLTASAGLSRPAQAKRRTAILALVAGLLALGFAWVDGGEEPIHTIVQPVELPNKDAGQ